ncbi:MAG: four helix bundle protein [bacterium]|nr:four helix bundle protein [Candidatus Margulisiibacteriota bacterium]
MFDFEKFEVYKKAKIFTKEISDLLDKLPNRYSRIIDQLTRASLSIPTKKSLL